MTSRNDTAAVGPTRGRAAPRDYPPIVLLSPDFAQEPTLPGREAHFLMRANYAESVSLAGGLPLILPYDHARMDAALDRADGVLVTGSTPGARVAPEREAFEDRLIGAAITRRMPVLGICHGMQMIGRHLGGRIEWAEFTDESARRRHLPAAIPDVMAHEVELAEHSPLNPGSGSSRRAVNSFHRHRLLGPGRFRVVATAEDGVIEAIAGDTQGFVLGLQWHPEYRLSALDESLMRTFLAECAAYARGKDRTGDQNEF